LKVPGKWRLEGARRLKFDIELPEKSVKNLKALLLHTTESGKIAYRWLFPACERAMRLRQRTYNLLTLGRSALCPTF
jgi:hypothetical protein